MALCVNRWKVLYGFCSWNALIEAIDYSINGSITEQTARKSAMLRMSEYEYVPVLNQAISKLL